MPDFELKGEDSLNMCKFVELSQEDSDHDVVPPKGNYSNFSDG